MHSHPAMGGNHARVGARSPRIGKMNVDPYERWASLFASERGQGMSTLRSSAKERFGAFDIYAPFFNRLGYRQGFKIIGVVISFRRFKFPGEIFTRLEA